MNLVSVNQHLNTLRRAKVGFGFCAEQDMPLVGTEKRKRMTGAKYGDVSDAVYMWYQQKCSSGIPVKGVELQAAAERSAVFWVNRI